MNGLFELEKAKDLFNKARHDYELFHSDPNDYALFNLLTTLNHLREWICPGGYKSYKGKKGKLFTPEERVHHNLYHDKNYQVVNELCNNSKHFTDSGIGAKTEVQHGFLCDISCFGDSFDHRNYLVDNKDLRDILEEVLKIYKKYFEQKKSIALKQANT